MSEVRRTDRPTLRRLRAGDGELVRRLNAMFGDAFEDSDTYGRRPPSDAYLARALAREGVIATVALEGEEVIGGLVAYELDKLEQERREIYIYDLAVRADRRRRGIATGLIEHLRTIAAERGAYVIYVQADAGDGPAMALYSRLGTREDVHHFDIAVDR